MTKKRPRSRLRPRPRPRPRRKTASKKKKRARPKVSLAQAAFVGIGSYMTAYLTVKLGWPFWPTYILAFVSCFCVGWVLGYPALRVQHHYLAFVTLALKSLVEWRQRRADAERAEDVPPAERIAA